MAKLSKRMRLIRERVEAGKLYDVNEADTAGTTAANQIY